jgi:hypothetical protein
MLELDDKRRKQALDFGALGYSAERIALLWDEPAKAVQEAMQGELGRIYRRGAALVQYALEVRQLELARSGDQRALSRFESMTRLRRPGGLGELGALAEALPSGPDTEARVEADWPQREGQK